jgi:hypothetical protein
MSADYGWDEDDCDRPEFDPLGIGQDAPLRGDIGIEARLDRDRQISLTQAHPNFRR